MRLKSKKEKHIHEGEQRRVKGKHDVILMSNKTIPQTHAILFLEKWFTMAFAEQAVKWLNVRERKAPSMTWSEGGRLSREQPLVSQSFWSVCFTKSFDSNI